MVVLFALRVPDSVATSFGYRGNVSVFAVDANLWPPHLPQLLDGYGEDGLPEVVRAHVVFDFLFPVAYGLLLFNVLVRIRICRPGFRSTLLALPFMAVMADWLENVSFIFLALSDSPRSMQFVWLTGTLTWVKFLALGASIGVAFWWGFSAKTTSPR
jgi:hypothetical protein